jgi:polyketide cyclase/dehydrase/lipid transport protein
MRIEKSIVVARPMEEAWNFIADGRNDPRWCDKVDSVEQLTGEGLGADASYSVLHRPIRLKRPKELVVSVPEFDPPRRMRVREEDDDGVFDVVYELEQAPQGTRLTQRDHIDWKIPRFQQPLARVMVSRDLQRQFATLKRVLESAPE